MITAPVAEFKAIVDTAGGRIIGYAAPLRGMAPCRIQVRNGGQIVAAVAATEFAGDNCPVRLGWCGFTLPLRIGLFALNNTAELVCEASGRTLVQLSLDSAQLVDLPVPAASPMPTTVLDLVTPDSQSTSVGGIVELIQAVVARTSAEKGVHALYEMLLLRGADGGGMQIYRRKMTTQSGIETAVRSIMSSEEYASLPKDCRFHSPYHSQRTIAALLALSEAEVDEPTTASEEEAEPVIVRLQDLILAQRESEERAARDRQRRDEDQSASQQLQELASSAPRPTGDEELMAKIALTLLGTPAWWGLMPKHWQRRKRAERLQRAGVFDGFAYLRRYPDVGKAGADPVQHYLMFGRQEGRSI